jgi:hypothetical protein
MNKVFLFFLLLGNLYGSLALSQDLVVSNEGDSLNCKVLEQTANSVVLFFRKGDQSVNTELPRNLFKLIVIGYYNSIQKDSIQKDTAQTFTETSTAIAEQRDQVSTTVVSDTLKPLNQENVIDNPSTDTTSQVQGNQPLLNSMASAHGIAVSRWYAGINGGYAIRLFRMQIKFSDAYKAYQKELKTGFAVGASGGYFVWKNVGLGLTGELYKSAGSMSDNSRKDAISIGYFGGSVVHRKTMQNKKGAVSTGLTMGYQRFKNRGREQSQDFILKGNAMGWGVNAGLDYRVGPKTAITFSASCLFGSLYKLTSESGTRRQMIKLNKDSSEDLSRISITVGLKFF